LLANYLNIIWVALIGFGFIPLYVKYLGVEAYGLIGLFAVLQVWLNLLDVGLSPTLGREMARFSVGGQNGRYILALLRTIEALAAIFMLLVVVGIGVGAPLLAKHWVKSEDLQLDTVISALRWMGLICGIGFVEGIYRSAVVGLQRQVVLSGLTSGVATVKGLGAVALIALVSPSIELFFAWQASCSLFMLLCLRTLVYKTLPAGKGVPRFDWHALKSIQTFAAGVFTTTLLATLLTQSDKFILTGMLSLEEWGHYSLAVVSAGALSLLYQPIYQVWLPKMSELVAAAKPQELKDFFHLGSQQVAVIVGSAAAVAILNARELLYIWTGDWGLVDKFAPIFCFLVAGNTLNAMLAIPYGLQLANGLTSLGVRVNAVAVLVLIPALLLVVPTYRGIGAAALWVALNLGYLLIGMHFMFSRLMASEKWTWYRDDLLIPLLTSYVLAAVLCWLIPIPDNRAEGLLVLLVMGAAVLVTSAAVSPQVRTHFIGSFKRKN
jgi:O-antigen/teichoic acid export membrane protein